MFYCRPELRGLGGAGEAEGTCQNGTGAGPSPWCESGIAASGSDCLNGNVNNLDCNVGTAASVMCTSGSGVVGSWCAVGNGV